VGDCKQVIFDYIVGCLPALCSCISWVGVVVGGCRRCFGVVSFRLLCCCVVVVWLLFVVGLDGCVVAFCVNGGCWICGFGFVVCVFV